MALASPALCAALHPDEKTYVWSGPDNAVRVVTAGSNVELDVYRAHFGPVHCIQYAPDGEIYASGSEDGTVRAHWGLDGMVVRCVCVCVFAV